MLSGGGAAAQSPERLGVINIHVENDLFGAGTDEHYTHGSRLSYTTPEIATGFEQTLKSRSRDMAELVPLFLQGEKPRVTFTLGQSIFTPANLHRRNPNPNDRPYAGWLYLGAGVLAQSGNANEIRRLDALELDLGMVGPASLAEETQKAVHSLINSTHPEGWGKQLRNEPGVVVSYVRKFVSPPQRLIGPIYVDGAPHAGVTLGNVYTYGAAGLTVRLGQKLPSDFGPPRIRPGLQGSDFFSPEGRGLGWYVFAGAEGRAIARNIFLDGNTFTNSRSVDKEPFVGDLQFGVVLTFQHVRLAMTNVIRSREFTGQDAFDDFGAISVSFRF